VLSGSNGTWQKGLPDLDAIGRFGRGHAGGFTVCRHGLKRQTLCRKFGLHPLQGGLELSRPHPLQPGI
jgi:hypothetical protein